MAKKKTMDEFVSEMKLTHPNIKILGNYINNKTPIECECLTCGNIWNPRPDQLIRGQSCPTCGLKKRVKNQSKTHDEFISELKETNPNIELVIGVYKNNHTKLIFQCKRCETIFSATPNNILRGSDCPNCFGTHLKSQEQYEKEIKEIHLNYEILGKYTNNKTPVKIICTNCNKIFYQSPLNSIKNRHGCPHCEKRYKGEIKISDCLDRMNIDYLVQKTFDNLIGVNGGKLRYDFYLPTRNILIEYQGNFHDGSYLKNNFFSNERFKDQIEHDRRKREHADKHNIKLLEIWYKDFNKIEEILKNEL